MARIGVTGATGFIGGALVPRLAARGHQLALLDNRTGPMRVEHPRLPAERFDFESPEALRLLEGCDVVVHLAAVSGVMACAKDPAGTARINVEGSSRLFEALARRHVPVVFASSLSTVGSPEQMPVTESTPARPTHAYARQKAEGEAALRRIAREHGVAGAVLRMSNVYGGYDAEGDRINKGNVLHLFAEQAVTEGLLRINAPGTQRRDFIHIADALAHWVKVAEMLAASPNGEAATYNLASGESYSVIELAEMVQLAWGREQASRPPLRLETVENPRGGIELIDPSFTVSRRATEERLGLACHHRVEDEIPVELAAVFAAHRAAP
jgi:UDP-glucose 4-epimerase